MEGIFIGPAPNGRGTGYYVVLGDVVEFHRTLAAAQAALAK